MLENAINELQKNLALSIASRLIAFLGLSAILIQIISLVSIFIIPNQPTYLYPIAIIQFFINILFGSLLIALGININKGKLWAIYTGITGAIILTPLGLYSGFIAGIPSNNYIYPIMGLGIPLAMLILLIVGLKKNSQKSN